MAYVDVSFPRVRIGQRRPERRPQTVVTSRSGRRQTLLHTTRPQRSWQVDLTACSPAERQSVIDFLRGVAAGDSFRFRDWSEFESGCTLSDDEIAITHGTPVLIGTGNGTATQFQLVARSGNGSLPWSIPVTKPVASGLRVYLGGVNQTSGWSLNASTGVVTFSSPPGSGVAVAWSGIYDMHVQVAGDTLTMVLGSQTTGEWDSVELIEVME